MEGTASVAGVGAGMTQNMQSMQSVQQQPREFTPPNVEVINGVGSAALQLLRSIIVDPAIGQNLDLVA